MKHRRGLTATSVIQIALTLAAASGCAAPAPLPSNPSIHRLQAVRRLTIVASGESRFAVIEYSAEPGRTFDEVLKWTPYRWLSPLVALVHDGINALAAPDRKTVAGSDLNTISPRAIVAAELARRLQASGRLDEILQLDREPVGEDRQRADALLRLAVPRWGLVRVRDSEPGLVSAFSDVQAQLVMRETGVVAWELSEDVTHPDRLPLEQFKGQHILTRTELHEVLERAGHRLASELLYAWSTDQ